MRVQAALLSHSLRALRHRNFRLFIGGQIVSLSGSWMQRVALGWLVYRLTGSAFLLGVVGFAGQFPALVMTPLAGVWADRWSRYRMVVLTQSLAMLQALTLAALVLADVVAVWHIVALAVWLGVVNGIDIPARQSFLVELVENRQDLPNAIALNSSTFNAARLVGPSLGGILISFVGEGVVFLVNGLSYIAVLAALAAIRLPISPTPAGPEIPLWRTLTDGVRYAFDSSAIRSLLLLTGLVSLAGFPFLVLMPIFATDVFHGGPRTLGFLVGANGVGALLGALYLASRRTVLGLDRLIAVSAGLFSASLLGLALARSQGEAMFLVSLAGLAMMGQLASTNTILQTVVADDLRGRVMSLYSMSFLVMMPIGSLLAGAAASRFGAPATVGLGGLICLLGATAFGRALPRIRQATGPIYSRLGILDGPKGG